MGTELGNKVAKLVKSLDKLASDIQKDIKRIAEVAKELKKSSDKEKGE